MVREATLRAACRAADPVGCCLALEGRLSGSDSREGLTRVLRRASERDLRFRVAAATEGGSQQLNGASDSMAAGPKCLSTEMHQLSADVLNAFQAHAQPADPISKAASKQASGRLYSPERAAFTQEDSLVHPVPPVPRKESAGVALNGVNSSSKTAAGSPVQRPSITAAIERTSTAMLDANGGVDHGAGMHDPSCTCPPYAVKSTCGKRPNMEDTYALCPNICELPISPVSHEYADKLPHRIAVQFENHCAYIEVGDSTAEQSQQEQQRQQAGSANGVAPQQWQQQAVQSQQQRAELSVPQQQPDQQCQQAEGTTAAFVGAANLVSTPLAAVPDVENSVSSLSSSSDSGCVEKLHFFGVYDGHGGIEASQHCAQRLHYHLSKAVADVAIAYLEASAGGEPTGRWNPEVQYVPVDTVRIGESGTCDVSPGDCTLAAQAAAEDAASSDITVQRSAGSSMQGAITTSSDRDYGRSVSNTSTGNSGSAAADCEVDSNEGSAEGSEGLGTSFCGMMEDVLREAFLKTDEEFSNSGLQAGLVGSTAVVALVGTHRVWIANCGDSRAVLSRGGRAIQVTDDHKPEREDEAERVEKAGGQVLYWNGHRVMGVLAMSRAIGDHCLRPYVIPEPEISVFARHARDEILLLASDGLWDVLSNQEAADLALRSIKRARDKGASRKAAARVAATVLTKAAVDRGSRDNITVVIIDLSPPPVGGDKGCSGDKASSKEAALQDAALVRQASSAIDECAKAANSSRGAGSGDQVLKLDLTASSSARSGSNGRLSSGRSSSAPACNPFAAAAASPFSTAATGSSELPLPTGASGTGSVAADGLLPTGPAAAERNSYRSSISSGPTGSNGHLCGSNTGSNAFANVASSAFANASPLLGVNGFEADAPCQVVSGLADELDSIDLSGPGAAAAAGKGSCQNVMASIASVAAVSSAADGSTTSSQLEEQPTLVEPPPFMQRQPSSSPFSAFQSAAPFGDGDGF
eukprot:GHRR01006816.1.p1 GENE.GHRR01006816.1~~GHRR01006816.1.p1  ORF type:complete len:982 (+),score=374.26 GHRR01006816.1:635-3580(+)